MSHRIIIDSISSPPSEVATASEVSTVWYSFTFQPSHNLADADVMKRIAKIHRVLNRLEQELTEP